MIIYWLGVGKTNLFAHITVLFYLSHVDSSTVQVHLQKMVMGKMNIVAGVPKEELLFAVMTAQMCSAK